MSSMPMHDDFTQAKEVAPSAITSAAHELVSPKRGVIDNLRKRMRDLPLTGKMYFLIALQIGNLVLLAGTSIFVVETILFSNADAQTRWWLYAIMAAAMVFALASAVWAVAFAREDIIKAIVDINGEMRKLADRREDISIPGLDRGDEIGDIARALEVLHRASVEHRALQIEHEASRTQQREALLALALHFEQSVGDVVGNVASAATQLQSTAGLVATASEQSRSQTDVVTKSMDKAAGGATAAAAASDEFAMSIEEISRQAYSSADLARRSSASADDADSKISALLGKRGRNRAYRRTDPDNRPAHQLAGPERVNRGGSWRRGRTRLCGRRLRSERSRGANLASHEQGR